MTRPFAPIVVIVALAAGCGRAGERPLVIGSKVFTESVVLGELLTQAAHAAGVPAEHRREVGGTRVVFEALKRGDIDAYVEYSGTLTEELVPGVADDAMPGALAAMGISMARPLGFNNTYAIGMMAGEAERLGVRTISDLARHPDLELGFANEFMSRGDGWPSLRARYSLPHARVRGLDHDLAYRALEAGQIAATDLYSTDAEIRAYGLRVLEDDRRHFPRYHAVVLYRSDAATRAGAAIAAWDRLAGRVDEASMIGMNARAKIERVPEAQVARDFLAAITGQAAEVRATSRTTRILARAREHLLLVAVSLAAAIALGLPLGILAAKRRRIGRLVIALVAVVQTVPSLALLVFMIPLLGIGTWPAMAALFLYSLLPIVRNTHQGLTGISAELRDSARALGLPPSAVLSRIEVPLASPAIVAGIKTAAVINVGTATLGALVGAGGFGQPILTGIRLADTSLILEGAVPAALLALAAQALLDLAERVIVPKGLRLTRGW
ncbi:MAG: ABC transporter permease subunit [Acidobacteriota bacterium]|nr:ABC transporter permease subunit [Acidobacteriota bacterium]